MAHDSFESSRAKKKKKEARICVWVRLLSAMFRNAQMTCLRVLLRGCFAHKVKPSELEPESQREDHVMTSISPKTVIEATFSVLGFVMGFSSMMAMPYLFRISGIAAALAILLANFVSFFTAWLLGFVLEHARLEGEAKPNFGTVGMLAFGNRFRVLMHVISVIDSFLYGVIVLIIIGANAPLFLPLTSTKAILISSFLPALLGRVPERILAYMQAVGASATLVACGIIVASGMASDSFVGHRALVRGGMNEMKTSFSVGFFCCSLHVYYPGIYNSVATRKDYSKALFMGYVAFIVVACCFGTISLSIFGDAIQPLVSNNVARDADLMPIAGFQWMSFVVGAMALTKNVFTLKPAMQPLVEFTVDALNPHRSPISNIHRVQKLFCYVAAGIVACFLQGFIIGVEETIGQLLYSLTGLVIPSMLYLKLFRPTRLVRIGALCSLCLGILMFVVGIASLGLRLRFLLWASNSMLIDGDDKS